MAETIIAYALTSRQRVKDRLGITSVDFDTLIDRLVSAATDFIESMTNRRFKEATYSNEVYSVYGDDEPFLLLKQAPVSALTLFQYRAGTVSNPSWTNYIADQFELVGDGVSGLIKVYGGLPKGVNIVRATYTAGFKIDFPNAGTATHTLPFDISDLCERLVVRAFKKREAAGVQTQAAGEAATTWASDLEAEDKLVIGKYQRTKIM